MVRMTPFTTFTDEDTSTGKMDEAHIHKGIRLSQLNDQVANKLRKFDTTNDGGLSSHELVSAVVTLQKQSDAYKKVIWLLIPVLCLLVMSVFGMTLLAIRVTKDVKVSDNVMTTMDGQVLQTAPAYQTRLQFQQLNTNISTDGNISKPVSKMITLSPWTTTKVLSIGYCVFSDSMQFYLQFAQQVYANIKHVQIIDVLYLQSTTPVATYDYTIVQRAWNVDEYGSYHATFQVQSPVCAVSFAFDCSSSELKMKVEDGCLDSRILSQYYLYQQTPYQTGTSGNGEGGSGGDGGRVVKPTLSTLTKQVQVKASSYITCSHGCNGLV